MLTVTANITYCIILIEYVNEFQVNMCIMCTCTMYRQVQCIVCVKHYMYMYVVEKYHLGNFDKSGVFIQHRFFFPYLPASTCVIHIEPQMVQY